MYTKHNETNSNVLLVPFTDGVKNLQVATDLEKAYETEGKQLIKILRKIFH